MPVDGERVAELTELEVDDVIEDEVERDVDAGHAYKARLDDDRQTGRRYQSCTTIICLTSNVTKMLSEMSSAKKEDLFMFLMDNFLCQSRYGYVAYSICKQINVFNHFVVH